MLKPLAVLAHQKGLELICDIDPAVPAGIVGDPVRVRQVLGNLVGNAIKFTERGHVLLGVREDSRGDGCTRLHFRVTDTGIGIPPDKHATIFEAFSQADGSTTRRFGGTGLGLTISSTLVQMMGGRIWVESEPGAGSTFHFTAGFDIAQLPDAQPQRREPLLADLPVLIVDDNAVNRRIFHEQLTRWQMKPTAVEGGAAAIQAHGRRRTRRQPVRARAARRQHAGHGRLCRRRADREPARAGGRHDHDADLVGPVWRYDTMRRAGNLGVSDETDHGKPPVGLDLPCRRKACARASARPAAHAHGLAAIRPLKVLLAEDNVVNQRVAVGLLSQRGHHVTVTNNGREALAALERETFDLVLMDVQMPEMGGLEATAAIRERERHTGGHVRIVAMTAHAMTGDRERCLAAGMDAYLPSPSTSKCCSPSSSRTPAGQPTRLSLFPPSIAQT